MTTLSSQAGLEDRGPRRAASAKVREAKFDDYAAVAALQIRHGLQVESYDQWMHLWIHNPLYHELSNWPIGWVLDEENSNIVGYIGNIPLSYEFKGERIVAATSRAWAVDPRFRSYSFALLSAFFKQKNVQLFINTTVNAYATAGHKAFRASRVPVGAWDQSLFWITGYRGIAASLLANKRLPALKLLKFPLSFGVFVRDIFTTNRQRPHSTGIAVRDCSRFDVRFDAFWKELYLRNFHLLLATRSQQMLAWRFQSSLDEDRAWVLTVEDGPRLAAYAIFMRRDNNRLGLNRLMLIDFQSLNRNNEVIVPI